LRRATIGNDFQPRRPRSPTALLHVKVTRIASPIPLMPAKAHI
jgi:hypothetical protein